MSRHWGRMLPTKACIAGGLLAVLCLPLLAEDRPEPAPASTAKESSKPGEPAAAKPGAEEPATSTSASEPPTGEDVLADAKKHRLAFKFQPDQVVRYSVRNEMELTSHFSGSTETARNKSEARRSYRVTQVTPNGEGDLQLTIEWVHMVAQFDNGISKTKPIEFQSDDPAKQPRQFQHIRATVGAPQATIRFNPFGRPLKVEPINGAQPASAAPAPVGAPGVPAGPAAAVAATMAADASHENYLILFPEQPVAVGESWKERFDIVAREPPDNLPVRVTMLRSYKLAEVKEGRATIEFATAILTPIKNAAIAAQLMQRETVGKFVFDVEHGLIISRDATCDRTVIDSLGPKSLTRAVSRYHEELLPVAATAGRDEQAATTTAK